MTGVLVSAQGMCVYLPVYLRLSAQGVSCGGGVCLGVCPEGICWGVCWLGGWGQGLPWGVCLGASTFGGVCLAGECLPRWMSAQLAACVCLRGGVCSGSVYLGDLPGWGVSTQVGVCPVDCMCLADGVGSDQGVST